MTKKILNWLSVIVWMGIIFFFSSQPAIKASNFALVDFVVKKNAHIAEFFILFFLLYRAFTKNKFERAFLISVLFAFSDEAHQLFTPGRTALLRDVAIDSLGISAAFILTYFKSKS